MKKIAVIISCAYLLLACSNDTTPQLNASSHKLKRIVYTPRFSTGTTGQETCFVTYTGNNISEFNLIYKKILLFYDASGVLTRMESYALGDPQIMESHNYIKGWNIGGFFIQSIDSNYFNGHFQATGLTNYYYNGNTYSYITGVVSNNLNVSFQETTYEWDHDDPVLFKFTEPNTTIQQTDSITYDITRINKFNQAFPAFIFQGISNDGTLFDGYDKYILYHFMSKHIITKVTTTGSEYYKHIGEFTYTFDSDGFITEIKLNGYTLLRYTYE